MKMKPLIALLLVTSAGASLASQPAMAGHYYSRQDLRTCQDEGQNAVAGAIFGGIAGALLSGALGGDPGMGAIAGAATGGILGLDMSCRDQIVYVDNVDRCLDEGSYNQPYTWRGGQVVVRQKYRRRDGVECREYQSTVRTRGGSVTKSEVACRERGVWMHGYESRDFEPRGTRTGESYHREYNNYDQLDRGSQDQILPPESDDQDSQ
ncbi:MAG: hypothetical protein ACXWQO_01960 [Bdellovibrionota bacterium]